MSHHPRLALVLLTRWEKLFWPGRASMAGTARIRGEYPVGCSKRPGFSPAQLWRAETRLVRRQVRSSAADPRFMFHASRFTVPLSEARTPLAAFFSILLTGITLALSACASGSEVDLTIHESERGAVYVERFPDLSFQAAHPITLSADTMARVLRGVVAQENRGVLPNPGHRQARGRSRV